LHLPQIDRCHPRLAPFESDSVHRHIGDVGSLKGESETSLVSSPDHGGMPGRVASPCAGLEAAEDAHSRAEDEGFVPCACRQINVGLAGGRPGHCGGEGRDGGLPGSRSVRASRRTHEDRPVPVPHDQDSHLRRRAIHQAIVHDQLERQVADLVRGGKAGGGHRGQGSNGRPVDLGPAEGEGIPVRIAAQASIQGYERPCRCETVGTDLRSGRRVGRDRVRHALGTGRGGKDQEGQCQERRATRNGQARAGAGRGGASESKHGAAYGLMQDVMSRDLLLCLPQ